MSFWKWSRLASSNGSADPSCPFPEGMNPAAVNDGTRGMMAAAAKYRDDISGATVTDGTSTGYTLSTFQVFDSFAHMDGAMIAFTPHVANGATVTLNVDGVGAKPLRLAPSVELQSNTLVVGTPYVATYFNATAEWILHGIGGNPYGIPLGGGLDLWSLTNPSSAYAFPLGQAVSRTVYSEYFNLVGTTFGSGDGATTFNLPDKGERVSVMKVAAASRLTANYFGGNSTVLGASGGSESVTMALVNLIQHSHPNTLTDPGHGHAVSGGVFGGTRNDFGAATGGYAGIIWGGTAISINASTSNITINNANAGSAAPTPIRTVPPTIVCNYIIRIK